MMRDLRNATPGPARTIPLKLASATMTADKKMIMECICADVGLDSYNEQLRRFLERQYQLVAIKRRALGVGGAGAGRQAKRGRALPDSSVQGSMVSTSGNDSNFEELLKHMRRMGAKLEAMENRLEMIDQKVERAAPSASWPR